MDPRDPEQFQAYHGPKQRAARDLLERVPLKAPLRIVDLGCAEGDGARLLAQRYAEARVTAVDASSADLDEAQARGDAEGRITFVAADPGQWVPERTVDLLYSSFALHLVPDHETLFPRLVQMLAPWGGAGRADAPRL
ncbi:methyltransferase domain-containing protein [Pararhodospirillum photometricum]|uniref:Trans-aconitate 2-methyltransferase n=1 Tax=Pararhodospirillum photometricum DSM 122 TaxID=1150469 RepID=H6SP81_PARPM|nr:methyltransferase domain-containing protein [Pararhodospirillum photometricum]CCG07153.1 Trans-aconitate 2-methyltransferase [Pararhodospirillum photometricum DSM 122]